MHASAVETEEVFDHHAWVQGFEPSGAYPVHQIAGRCPANLRHFSQRLAFLVVLTHIAARSVHNAACTRMQSKVSAFAVEQHVV